ncbi:MAG: hypothetical protein JXA69_08320 [Phycisphaerae bacterium]|nr:hypothetical protein [Phycisphaerae bacterium]
MVQKGVVQGWREEEMGDEEEERAAGCGTMTYVWNAENRLVEALPTSPASGDVMVRFAYD